MKSEFPNTKILGIRIDRVSINDVVSSSLSKIQIKEKVIISNLNIHAANLAYENYVFRNLINSSHIVFCDGFGIKLAVKAISGLNLQRFTPPDWFDYFAEECSKAGYSIFFLGTRQEIIEKAEKTMLARFPNLKIVGVHHGFFDKVYGSHENTDVVRFINATKPDVLVVGFGMPLQEQWISENFHDLQTHVVFPVGGYFDYLAGSVIRAPQWMTNYGLEWLGRLIIEPGRLWKRYIVGNPLFFWRVLKHHKLGKPLPFTISSEIVD